MKRSPDSDVWALVAATLGVWAAFTGNAHGIWGASRHALTVGFLSTMVFAIGQRVLPAFSGMRLLFSARLMFAALLLLTVGCVLRVGSEVLAYQRFRQFSLVMAAGIGNHRDDCRDSLCRKSVCRLRTAPAVDTGLLSFRKRSGRLRRYEPLQHGL